MSTLTSAVQNDANTSAVTRNARNDIDVLNGELAGEYFGIAAYAAALGTGLLETGASEIAEKFQGDHIEHAERLAEAIKDLGGTPIETQTWEQYAADAPPPPLDTQADVLSYAASLEVSGASASLAAVAKFSSPQLAVLAASISGVEAMHWSVLLGALGQDPAPVAFIPLPAI